MEVKYDKIGIGYNETRKADSYLTARFLYHLDPVKDHLYLDIGCGTGNYTNALSSSGFNFIGIDPSRKMLEKALLRNDAIEWKLGTAECTGLSNESVSGIIASLTIHHWNNLNKAFIELYRVLKPNSTIVIFTSTPKQMKGYWLNHYFPKMMNHSIEQMPFYNNVEFALKTAGFSVSKTEKYFIKPDLEDKFLYAGKHNPELYFNAAIRRGISSFSSLSNKEEVANGLLKTKQDVQSGQIKNVMDSYENDQGDYLFIIANKN